MSKIGLMQCCLVECQDAVDADRGNLPQAAKGVSHQLITWRKPTEETTPSILSSSTRGIDMASRKVSFVTIGQSPRTDILKDLNPLLESLEILERGVLDDFSPNELEAVAPLPDETPYVSRLRDGSQVLLSPAKILPLLQKALDSVVGSGAEMVVLLCTGSFPTLQCPVPLLFPSCLLRGFVKGVLPPEGTLGVVVPLSEQVAMARESWNSITPRVRTASLSPYLDFAAGVEECPTLEGSDTIVMDCLGYTTRHKEILKRLLNIPVILARTVVARAVQELIY